MNVLLVNPPYSSQRIWGRFGAAGGDMVPLGLAMVAACARQGGASLTVVDCAGEGYLAEDLRRIVGGRSFDVIGITAMTPTVTGAAACARVLRGCCRDVLIVLGGPHPTALPEQTLTEIPEADAIVIGEGEITFCELLRARSSGSPLNQVAGLAFRDGVGIRRTPARDRIADLDALPLPAYDLFPMGRYRPPVTRYRRLPAFGVLAGRGCPFGCTFCSRLVHGRRLRMRSVAHVLREIELLQQQYNCREIIFQDSSLCTDREWVVQLCDELMGRGFGLPWSCLARVEQVDLPLLRQMRRAGCWQISFGIESANQKTLDLLDKGNQVEQARAAVAAAHQAGIEVRASYMLGLPGEDRNDCLKTVEFAKSLGALYASFQTAVPLPGTGLHELAAQRGILADRSWEDFSFFADTTFFVEDGMTADELRDLCRSAWRSYYLTPRVVVRHLRQMPYHLTGTVRHLRAAAAMLARS